MKKAFSFVFLFLTACSVTFAQQGFERKASTLLLQQLSKLHDNDSVVVSIQTTTQGFAEIKNLKILSSYPGASVCVAQLKKTDLIQLLQHGIILFADLPKIPKEELTTGSLDLSVNKINFSHSTYPQVKGDSITVSIKEQKFDTTDIDYKNRIIQSGQPAPGTTTHASVMATILAGGGNTSWFARGVAPGAYITSATFASLIPQPDSVYRKYNISIQNHSYGTVIENFYGNEASAYDASVVNNPMLVDVFSSGNSGSSNATSGIYISVPNTSNLTGNFKMAKNIIVAGAVDSFANVAALSSRGPAYDGRVKPELVAFGEDGSSGAAAMTSGSAALVQQAYKFSHASNLPPASLVKAVLVNSAEDIGNAHVDYISGYGNLNTYKAVQTVLEGRYFIDSVIASQTKTFNLSIPSGLKQVKVSVSWTDPAAPSNASKALVNNLDALLRQPSSGSSWQPWVLDPSPANIFLPAVRKTDTLNNTEQITIDNPVAGNYQLDITGTTVTGNRQVFSIAYQYDTANRFYFTFPTGLEQVQSGKTNVLRWETTVGGTGKIEYALNGGIWQTITSNADLAKKYFQWNAPDTIAMAQLRMSISALADVLSDSFVISKQVAISTGFNCADSFLLTWNKLPVSQYRIYELGNKYLQPFQLVNDTFIILRKSTHSSLYYAVAPVVAGHDGLRSTTLKYDAQGVECYFRNFYIQLQNGNTVLFTAGIGSLYQVAAISFQRWTNGQYKTLQTINAPSTLSFSFSDTGLRRGVNNYRLELKLTNGAVIYSEIVPVYYFPDLPVIVYPNPAPQHGDVKIISREAVRYSIKVFDVHGRLVLERNLSDVFNILPGYTLSKGLYFIMITGDEGKLTTQKLVVY